MSDKKFRVLLAEGEAGEIGDALRDLYPDAESQLELNRVSTVPILLATIELAAPEAIFLELSLGRPDPLDAVRRVHRAAPGIPLIVLADKADKTLANRSTSAGAMEYLLKGFVDGKSVGRALRTALERNTVETLTDLLRDESTGLYNRDGFVTLGARAMERAGRSGGTMVLLCAMIENLRSLRREVGPGGSDQAVRETAELLRSCFRRSDLIGRLGETQFAALAVDAAEPSIPILRQRVESRLAIHDQILQPCGPLSLRLSLGSWGQNDARTFTEFLDATESELRQPAAMAS